MSGNITPKSEEKDISIAEETLAATTLSARSSPTKQETSPPPLKRGFNGKQNAAPQLIGDLPRAEEDALRTFETLKNNHYQYGTLGRSKEILESMTCDCQYEHGSDDPWLACGDGSDCINRLTQVECLEDDCRCGSHCLNQRFQRKQYSKIQVVLTEKKGYGLRAGSDIKKDAFIYEYVGDVVNQASFAKRMRDYAQEGIRHFYFMMLQKGEFIDATKRGGIGRFANHSCSPNCYVARWSIGEFVRMGIFAKRNIQKDEELTFNYNVDRYGHDPQLCYCGEPNCIGYIGGKTQTEVAVMDDLYLDALGISDEVESLGLKGTKKKKGKKLDEDYVPILKPLVEKDIPKVIQAVRQTQSRKVLLKLLSRIKMSEDEAALRQLMRLRGFSLMKNVLDDYDQDFEIQITVMECISTWPLMHRNKVEDSGIEEPIKAFASSEQEGLKSLAERLLSKWASLEVAYRIPKRAKMEQSDSGDLNSSMYELAVDARPIKRSRLVEEEETPVLEHLQHLKPLGFTKRESSTPVLATPIPIEPPTPTKSAAPSRQAIAQVIAAAALAREEAAKIALAEAQKKAEQEQKEQKRRELKAQRAAAKSSSKKLSLEEKEALKEKRLLKLVGVVVVKCMSKHKDQFDHDSFKKYAKELTQTIADKEKKSQSYSSGKLDALSDEKVIKIKKFSKEYIAKVIRKLQKSKRHVSSSAAQSSTSRSETSGSGEPASALGDIDMSVEDALGLDFDDIDIDIEDPSPGTEIQGPEPDVRIADPGATPVESGDNIPWESNLGTGIKGLSTDVPESIYSEL